MLKLTKKYTFCSVKLNYIKKREKKIPHFFFKKY